MGFNLFVTCFGKLNVCLPGLLRLLFEGMQHVNRIFELGNVDDPPLTFPMYSDLHDSRTTVFMGFQSAGSCPI
jgi:hypothetical protein